MMNNYKDTAKAYELAERMVFAKLPDWKKEEIVNCRVNGITNSRILGDYSKEIILLAENDNAVLSDSYPPVPSMTRGGKPIKAVEEEIAPSPS